MTAAAHVPAGDAGAGACLGLCSFLGCDGPADIAGNENEERHERCQAPAQHRTCFYPSSHFAIVHAAGSGLQVVPAVIRRDRTKRQVNVSQALHRARWRRTACSLICRHDACE